MEQAYNRSNRQHKIPCSFIKNFEQQYTKGLCFKIVKKSNKIGRDYKG